MFSVLLLGANRSDSLQREDGRCFSFIAVGFAVVLLGHHAPRPQWDTTINFPKITMQ